MQNHTNTRIGGLLTGRAFEQSRLGLPSLCATRTLAMIVISASVLCGVSSAQEPPALIKEVQAPVHVTAGETATIEITPPADIAEPLWLVFSVDGEQRTFHRYFRHDTPPPEVAEGESAPRNVPCRRIEVSLPKERPFPLYVWLEMWGGGCHTRDERGFRGKNGGWVNARSRNPNKWGWSKAATVNPDEPIERIDCFVPPQVSGLIRAAVLTADKKFRPDTDKQAPGVFRWQTNASSAGSHTLRVSALDTKSGKKETREVTINVLAEENEAIQPLAAPARYVDLKAAADVPLFPDDPAMRVVGKEFKGKETFDCLGFRFPLQQRGPAFVAVTLRAADKGPRKAEIPQEQDLVKIVPAMLPDDVDIPVKLKGRHISFLHAMRGGGLLLDTLFAYQVEYDDGETVDIPIREGEQIGGYLMDYATTEAVRVHYSMIGNASVGIFLYEWENPRPEHEIVRISMNAKARALAYALGIAAHDQRVGVESARTKGEGIVQVTADYTATLGPVKRGLFSINDHASGSDLKAMAALAEVAPPTIRSWNRIRPPKDNPTKRFEPAKDLASEAVRKAYPEYIKRLESRSRYYRALVEHANIPLFFTIAQMNFGPKGVLLDDPAVFDAQVAWYTDVLKWMWNDIGIETPYIALFNESGIGRPVELRHKQYRFFNALADSIRAANPDVKIGGMSECWPDMAIIREFIQACGEHADFISWNLYATGSAEKPPFAELMQRTDRYAIFSNNIRKANTELLPGRPLEQAVSEYNINYKAWRPIDHRLHKGYGAVWTFSVLNNLLYKGSLDLAYYWHFVGGAYGVVAPDGLYPAGTVFHLLSTRTRQGQLCLARSADESRVQCLAVATPGEYLLALVNKTPKPQTVELQLLNYFPASEPELTPHSTEEWTVAAEDDRFSLRKLRTPANRDQTVSLPPFSLRMVFAPCSSREPGQP